MSLALLQSDAATATSSSSGDDAGIVLREVSHLVMSSLPESRAHRVRLRDLNDEGLPELLVSGWKQIGVYAFTVDGKVQPLQEIPFRYTIENFLVDDISGDSVPDLIVPEREFGRIVLLEGNRACHFREVAVLPITRSPVDCELLHVNNDKIPDIFYATDSGRLFSLLSRGKMYRYTERVSMPIEQYACEMATADFNGDGLPDLIAGGSTYFRTGKAWIPGPRLSSSGWIRSMDVMDLDGDHRAEVIAVTTEPSMVHIHQLTRNESWEEVGSWTMTDSFPWDAEGRRHRPVLRKGDVTGDGVPDVSLVDNESGNLTIFHGPGLHILTEKTVLEISEQPTMDGRVRNQGCEPWDLSITEATADHKAFVAVAFRHCGVKVFRVSEVAGRVGSESNK